jgi:uncharacterized protein (TIGR03437 family)
VTAANPATAEEILSLLSQPFPASPLASVNSPSDITVNGTNAEILAAVGYPGGVNGYQVNFRMLPNTGAGLVAIQLSAAWVPGSPVNIAVR